jgi:hypothetical protein
VAKTLRDGQHLIEAEQMILEGNSYKKQGETVEFALEKVAAQFKMPKKEILNSSEGHGVPVEL